MGTDEIIAKLMELGERLAALIVTVEGIVTKQGETDAALAELTSIFNKRVEWSNAEFNSIREYIGSVSSDISGVRQQTAALQESIETAADALEEAAAKEEEEEEEEEEEAAEEIAGAQDVAEAEAESPIVPPIDEKPEAEENQKRKRHFVRI